jgi:hypothetical protein
MGRVEREKKTVAAMIQIYCHDQHGQRTGVCESCRALHDYAMLRLDRCQYGEQKSTCAKCPVHCYRPALRVDIQHVMRYAGPRMLCAHPILAVRHLLDGRKMPPSEPVRRGRRSPEV